MHGASEQCMQATEIERSPGTPSFSVTTRRRFTPHGISCSCLHAVTQLLHSMQRSASHRNFILAMLVSLAISGAWPPQATDPPLAGQRAQRAWGDVHYAANFSTWQSVVFVSCIIVTES